MQTGKTEAQEIRWVAQDLTETMGQTPDMSPALPFLITISFGFLYARTSSGVRTWFRHIQICMLPISGEIQVDVGELAEACWCGSQQVNQWMENGVRTRCGPSICSSQAGSLLSRPWEHRQPKGCRKKYLGNLTRFPTFDLKPTWVNPSKATSWDAVGKLRACRWLSWCSHSGSQRGGEGPRGL